MKKTQETTPSLSSLSDKQNSSKKLYVKTYGCQMNVYDSERMTDIMAPLGYEAVDTSEDADLVILNTCHIREKAAEKVYSDLGRVRKHQDQVAEDGRRMVIAVAGCVAQAEGAEIMKRAPFVDMVFGPQTYHRLPEMVARAVRASGGVLDTDFPTEDKFDHLPKVEAKNAVTSFLTVQEGCDKFCTFCVVPYTRGAEFSRPVAQVLEEAKRLASQGVRELTLLGQNVNAYHGEASSGKTWGLARLALELAEIDGIDRIRYTTSHPRDMDDELIAAHGTCDALMPYLHLPVQSGSDRILDAMNRRHTREDYFRIMDRLRDVRPDLALSGDFIVGFPGETDQDFAFTMDLIRRVRYAQAYSFKYSPRPGTPAATLSRQVDAQVASDRLQELQALLNQQQRDFNAAMLGKTIPVLFERTGRFEGQLAGRTPYNQAIHVEAPDHLMGQIASVHVSEVKPNSLGGMLSEAPPNAMGADLVSSQPAQTARVSVN